MNTSQEPSESYDIIFAGGGTCACLIAGRLAKAEPTLKILILEAGGHTLNNPIHVQPGRYFAHQNPATKTIRNHVSKPSEHVAGREIVIPSAHCLGGGSSVNFMVYTRASASDFDDWEKLGNPGWDSKSLLPLLKKTETYQVKPGQLTHGYEGPLKVSAGEKTDIGQQFLDVAAAYDTDRPILEDWNDLKSSNGYGIDETKGTRSDAPHHFVYNQASNLNLHVLTGCRVKRVIFEENKAVGVEYISENTDLSSVHQQENQVAKFVAASRLVVVSAGAMGSPGILERSGVGDVAILRSLGSDAKIDLPGVGENYQDHSGVFNTYAITDGAVTLDPVLREDAPFLAAQQRLWETEGKGILATNAWSAGAKLRPRSPKDFEELGPDFQNVWTDFFADATDKPVIAFGIVAGGLGVQDDGKKSSYMSTGIFNLYSRSRGNVHITNMTDPFAPYDINSGFLTDPADIALLRWAYKHTRELIRRHPLYRGEHLPGNPEFASTSPARCHASAMPVPVDAPDIAYTSEDDRVIEDFLRKRVQSSWHSLGTCAMKPREQGGVVDAKLNVYGVSGLKVADMSIAPSNVGANTYSTALAIGEKAAMLIAEELGIKGV